MKVIVILGKRLLDNGDMTEELRGRLDSGIALYRANEGSRIIVSGGMANPTAGIAEATKMREYLLGEGLATADVIAEEQSRTTKENAKLTKPIILQIAPEEVIICTSQVHLERRFLNPIRLFTRALKASGIRITTHAANEGIDYKHYA